MGSTPWLYPSGSMNSSVSVQYGPNKVFPTGLDFEDGATRLGRFRLGLSLAVMFAGALLASYAF